MLCLGRKERYDSLVTYPKVTNANVACSTGSRLAFLA